MPDEFCCAGGVTNFKKIGIVTYHDNYGKNHVCGLVTFEQENIEVIAKNCVFCGRDCSDFFTGGIYGQ